MWDWVNKLDELSKTGEPFAIVTVVRCEGSTPRTPGAKMLVTRSGCFFGTIGGGHLEHQALLDSRKCIEEGPTTMLLSYPLTIEAGRYCGGTAEILVEVINQGPLLYLFGAGHVGQSLCKTLVGTPFRIHLIDERAEWLHSEQIPESVRRYENSWRDFISQAYWDHERIYVIIMTHDHDVDFEILREILPRSTHYIGMIGSKTKWVQYQEMLIADGFDPARVAQIHCPIGLDIGGKAPQEIAVSVAAQLLKIHYGK